MSAVATFDENLLWHYRAKWLRDEYMDGDTITVLTDNGHGSRYEPRIRLIGYSAEERYTPAGKIATAALRAVLEQAVGKWNLRIISQQRQTVIVEGKTFDRYPSHTFIVTADGDLFDVVRLLRAPVVGSKANPVI